MTPQRMPTDEYTVTRQWLLKINDAIACGHTETVGKMLLHALECCGPCAQLEHNVECRQFYVKDHPEVNGRTAVKGEHGYTLRFPLQDGTELQVLCGEETLTRFSDMIGRMLIDNDAEAK
jgi:hypothetical protein